MLVPNLFLARALPSSHRMGIPNPLAPHPLLFTNQATIIPGVYYSWKVMVAIQTIHLAALGVLCADLLDMLLLHPSHLTTSHPGRQAGLWSEVMLLSCLMVSLFMLAIIKHPSQYDAMAGRVRSSSSLVSCKCVADVETKDADEPPGLELVEGLTASLEDE